MLDVWWLLLPSSLMVILLLFTALTLAARSYRPARLFGIITLLLVALPITFDVAGRLAWELERRVEPPTELPQSVDGILVLGGSVEWRISRERQQLTLSDAGERLLAGAALARRYPDARLVLGGVYREDVESDFVAVPNEQSLIFGDEFRGRRVEFMGEARSTYEEGLLALERLSPRAGETWILVTSAMHMPRALAVFNTLGWRLTPYPVDYQTAGEPELFGPARTPAQSLAALDAAVREWGAIFVYDRTGRIEWP
ncbi:MAG: YdcF family protein [Trueperaceae bacterium]